MKNISFHAGFMRKPGRLSDYAKAIRNMEKVLGYYNAKATAAGVIRRCPNSKMLYGWSVSDVWNHWHTPGTNIECHWNRAEFKLSGDMELMFPEMLIAMEAAKAVPGVMITDSFGKFAHQEPLRPGLLTEFLIAIGIIDEEENNGI